MGRYVGIPLLFLAALLNATLMAELRLGGGAPDLVFLIVVTWAMLAEPRDAYLWAIVGGVAQDWFSMAPLGASSLALLIVAFVVDALFGRVPRGNLLLPPLVAAGGTVLYHLLMIAVLRMQSIVIPVGHGLTYVTLPTVILHALLALPVYRLTGVVHYWLTPRRVRLD